MSLRTALLLPLLAALFAHAQAAQPQLRVQLPATATAPASGRLLVFAEPASSALEKAKGGPVITVDASPFGGQDASAAGMDITRLAPGQAVAMDTESLAWPRPFSQLPAGDYYVQAVLDTARDDNYAGRGPDDLLSAPVKMALGGDAGAATLVLDQRLPEAGDPWQLPERVPQALRAAAPAAKAATHAIDFTSPALSAFWGRPIQMRGWVVLPPGYAVATAGSAEESAKSQGPIAAVVPLMLFVMATILMVQLQSFQRLFLVVAVAPLGLIGVVAALLPSGAPLGFVTILGVLALIGILIRNSVILIVQIEDHVRDGADRWTAVIEASEHRMRPIALTAAAASLALIPIAREVFWGPMAYAMMGGIIAGTAITLLFLPALYVAWFRLKEPEDAREEKTEDAAAPGGA